jgi:uncharacterized protein YodC (DUF2158 family)
MTKHVFNAKTEGLDLAPFLTGMFWHKGENFPAVRVTPENIGLLCLEFDAELETDGRDNPFFEFKAKREHDTVGDRILTVTLADWIFPRGDELHVWPNPIFEATFRVSRGGEYLMSIVEQETARSNMAWEESEMRETLMSDAAQQETWSVNDEVELIESGNLATVVGVVPDGTVVELQFKNGGAVGTAWFKSDEVKKHVITEPKFADNEEVRVIDTGERGVVVQIYSDDRYMVRMIDGDPVQKYVYNAAQLGRVDLDWEAQALAFRQMADDKARQTGDISAEEWHARNGVREDFEVGQKVVVKKTERTGQIVRVAEAGGFEVAMDDIGGGSYVFGRGELAPCYTKDPGQRFRMFETVYAGEKSALDKGEVIDVHQDTENPQLHTYTVRFDHGTFRMSEEELRNISDLL